MTGFWGYALLVVFVVAGTASLVAAVVRVLLFAERKEAESRGAGRAGRPEPARIAARSAAARRVGDSPRREELVMTPEQSRELDEEWSSLVSRLR